MKKTISNKQLADESGLTQGQISYILNGKSIPPGPTAQKLSDATKRLGIKTKPEDWIFNISKIIKAIRGGK